MSASELSSLTPINAAASSTAAAVRQLLDHVMVADDTAVDRAALASRNLEHLLASLTEGLRYHVVVPVGVPAASPEHVPEFLRTKREPGIDVADAAGLAAARASPRSVAEVQAFNLEAQKLADSFADALRQRSR